MITIEVGPWIGTKGLAEKEVEALRAGAEKAVLKGALHMEGALKKKLTGPRSGRTYRVPGTKNATYQASAPGEPPAVMLGKLRQSITHTLPKWAGNEVSSIVGTAQPQAALLEYGGMAGNGARILPRPYMAPTFLEEESALDAILREAVEVTPK